MAQLDKADLEQMTDDYLQSLEPERLVTVAKNLRALAVEQLEKLEESSKTSSRPPSSDSPYQSTPKPDTETSPVAAEAESSVLAPSAEGSSEAGAVDPKSDEGAPSAPPSSPGSKGFGRRSAGKQRGAQGKWRDQPLKAERTIPHYPERCAACDAPLGEEHRDAKPHGGYYQFELNRQGQGFSIECQLHHYYGASCSCGHHSQAQPGQGECSVVTGRKVQLQLQEQVLIGPMLATFIASLSVRYRLSRVKIQEFLWDWAGVALSIGSLDRSIREAGFACRPVVEVLIEELQTAELLHLDETPWYESGRLCWLWVALSAISVVFFIGPRTKERLLQVISTAFVGWLVTDGYGAYRWYDHRQRCLAHLIRKALALSQAVDAEARQLGQWLLEEMRELIHALATAGHDDPDDPGTRRLQQVALLATASEHPKLKALAKEILNDWQAVVAFVSHPHLPVTNNEAERALRHAVMARHITHGTRSAEGSEAYAALLSVIETCRRRNLSPWPYLAEVIALRRKGLSVPPVPMPLPQAA
ncbi:IS66 family transposase [Nodosilinea sp. P-1105]|uniref:IS66 family transposase n=1 Tax=Nodosilinea sp. P-1105 TaxID=2546229 RepID=UPI00146DC6A5|nr:IS66 family transposase [Nodosilinea sp. P-1105]NMF86377.1 IS66 family transposase [Nodosilinea sp. P-1105]